MSNPFGKFVWYELMTDDAAAAEAFYTRLIGWNARDAGAGEIDYTAFTVGETRVAGLLATPLEAKAGGARPFWVGYVAVDDVDAYTAKFTDAGGAIHRDPADIAGVGRFSVVSDPQGAPLLLFKPSADAQTPPALPLDRPGVFNWRELMAADWPAAFDFYASVFGWTKDRTYDMGDFGAYQLFAAKDGEVIGGMMTKPAGVPSAFWTFYVAVEGIGAAIRRLEAGGGRLINGPHQAPTGSWVAQGLDPQGALFSLVSTQA